MVALAASVLLTGANSNLSSVLTPVSYAEMAQHSQDREGAADAVGLEALQCLYGHVGGASELFRHLAGEEETDEWSIAHYFSSHPEAEARIAALKELADRQGYQSDDAARVTCEVCSE